MTGSATTKRTIEEYQAMGLLLGMEYWEQYHAFSKGTIIDMDRRWIDADTLEVIENGLLVRLIHWRREKGFQ